MNPHDLDDIVASWRRERPDLDMSALRISVPLRHALESWERRRVDLLSEFGLTPSGLDILAALRRAGAPYRRTPSELARESLLTAGSISQRLSRLESAGLVTRNVDLDDRRVVRVELTDEGLHAIDVVLAPYMEQEQAIVSALSERQQRDLQRLLRSLGESCATE
jgi:DNA-binding MarR family transcriptional regulator